MPASVNVHCKMEQQGVQKQRCVQNSKKLQEALPHFSKFALRQILSQQPGMTQFHSDFRFAKKQRFQQLEGAGKKSAEKPKTQALGGGLSQTLHQTPPLKIEEKRHQAPLSEPPPCKGSGGKVEDVQRWWWCL